MNLSNKNYADVSDFNVQLTSGHISACYQWDMSSKPSFQGMDLL